MIDNQYKWHINTSFPHLSQSPWKITRLHTPARSPALENDLNTTNLISLMRCFWVFITSLLDHQCTIGVYRCFWSENDSENGELIIWNTDINGSLLGIIILGMAHSIEFLVDRRIISNKCSFYGKLHPICIE